MGSHQVEHTQYFPVPGQVEHDPLEIWNSVKVCLSGALQGIELKVRVVAIGITNQRETTICWNKHTGQPYHKAIVWNDTRTEELCEKLSQNGGVDKYREKTGLPIASYFSASKLLYLFDTIPGLREDAEQGDALFGTMDTWLMWRLSGGKAHATDVSNASRTLCMNLHTLQWDPEILSELNIPKTVLPSIHPSSHLFGHVDQDHGSHLVEAPLTSLHINSLSHDPTTCSVTQALENYHSFYRNVPISGVLGDQNAALFGQACFAPGDSKCTYGTGAFMLFNTGNTIMPSKRGLLTTVAYQLSEHPPASGDADSAARNVNASVAAPTVYALEGSVAYSGSVIQWLRDNLQIIPSAKETELIAKSVPDNGGVYFVPAFAGLFAPYWRGDARGAIVGLTAFNTKAHIVRAALEASAFQTVEVAHAMLQDSEHKMPLSKLRVDGGGTANSLMMQFLSDLLNVPLVKPKISETTALGAAFVAGLQVGLWRDTDELQALWQPDVTWQPAMPSSVRDHMMNSWRKAVSKSLDWVDHHPQNTSHQNAAAIPTATAPNTRSSGGGGGGNAASTGRGNAGSASVAAAQIATRPGGTRGGASKQKVAITAASMLALGIAIGFGSSQSFQAAQNQTVLRSLR